MIGLGDQGGIVFCVDFGLSKRYRHPKNLQHIPHRDGRSLTGTPRYASVNNHLGIEQSRRDDLESVGYVALYMLYGKLPWDDLNDYIQDYKNVNNHMKIKKTNLLKDEQIPPEVITYLSYCRNLKFEETPNYEYLLGLFE